MQEITIVVLSGIILIALMQVLLAIIIWRKFNSLESIKTKMTTQLNDIAGEVTETQRRISDHLCNDRAAIKKYIEEREHILIEMQSINKTVELMNQSVLFPDDVMQDLNEEINHRTTFFSQEAIRYCDSILETMERIKSKCKTL